MLARIKPRLTYANVVSTIALFVVLGGGAYATHTHKVGPKDIKKNAVKKKQLAFRAVNPPHIAQGAVRGPRGSDQHPHAIHRRGNPSKQHHRRHNNL